MTFAQPPYDLPAAFPGKVCTGHVDEKPIYEHRMGMTLRDWFAGMALQGNLAYSHVNPMHGNYQENSTWSAIAADCYAMADAMLNERQTATSQPEAAE